MLVSVQAKSSNSQVAFGALAHNRLRSIAAWAADELAFVSRAAVCFAAKVRSIRALFLSADGGRLHSVRHGGLPSHG